ncbi:MAG: hypothetical protein O3A80_04030 [bacterium]|nr:hypothetical protein [bacterium]
MCHILYMSADSWQNQGKSEVLTSINQQFLSRELAALDKQEQSVLEEVSRIQRLKAAAAQELLNSQSIAPEPLDISPEMADEAIAALRAEFDAKVEGGRDDGYVIQEDINFTAVEKKLRLEENKDKLEALYRMVKAGSCPAILKEEGGRYCIAEVFLDPISDRKKCVYSRRMALEAKRIWGNKYPNAIDEARKMGITLIDREIANAHLTLTSVSHSDIEDFVQATDAEERGGYVPIFQRVHATCARKAYCCITTIPSPAKAGLPNTFVAGWRGMLWV